MHDVRNIFYRAGVFFAILVGGVIFFGTLGSAFSGPATSGGSGSGAIGTNSSNNVSFGTPTTASNTRVYINATSTPTNSKYGLQILSPTSSPYFYVRNDGKVVMGGSVASSGALLTVWGDIYATNFFSGGTNPYSGFIGASNVTQGVMSGASANSSTAKFSFPSSLAVSSTVTSSVSQMLSVNGNGYFTTGLLVGRSTFTTSTAVEISNTTFGTPALRLNWNKTYTLDFIPMTFSSTSSFYSYISTNHPKGLAFQNSAFGPYPLLVATSGVSINTSTTGGVKNYALEVDGTFRAANTSTISGKVMVNTSTPLSSTSTLSIVGGTANGTSTTSAYATDFCVINASTNKCVSALGPSGGGQSYIAKWKTSASLGTSTITEPTSSLNLVNFNFPASASSGLKLWNGYFYSKKLSGNGGDVPASGASIRLMWAPNPRGAFFAGEVTSTQWDNLPTANGSYGFGFNNTVSKNAGLSVIFGDTNQLSKAQNSLVVGSGNSVGALTADRSFSVGTNNTIKSPNAFTFGSGNTVGARQTDTLTGGSNNLADGAATLALGSSTNAQGTYSITFGDDTSGHGGSSFAVGLGSSASGTGSIALGNNALADQDADAAYSIGTGAYSNGPKAIAIGGSNTGIPSAQGNGSIMFGQSLITTDDYSIGFGLGVVTSSIASYGSAANPLIIMGGNLGIGTVNPQSILDVAGPITQSSFLITTGNYSLNSTDPYGIYFVDTSITSQPSVNISLPNALTIPGSVYTIYKVDNGPKTVIFTATAGGLIVSSSSQVLSQQGQVAELTAYSTSTWIMTVYGP